MPEPEATTIETTEENEIQPTEATTTELALEYALKEKAKSALELDIKKIKEEMARIEIHLLLKFGSDGVKSIRTTEGLVYLHHGLWANCSDNEGLRGTAWAWMVKGSVNSNTLSATVRELPTDEETGKPILPEEVKEHVSISDKWSVRVRAA